MQPSRHCWTRGQARIVVLGQVGRHQGRAGQGHVDYVLIAVDNYDGGDEDQDDELVSSDYL